MGSVPKSGLTSLLAPPALALFLVGMSMLAPSRSACAAEPGEEISELRRVLERAEESLPPAEATLGTHRETKPAFRGEPSTTRSTGSRGTTTDWTPYAGAFGHEEAAHLLHRAVIGPKWSEVETAATTGLSGTVDLLLAPRFPPSSPGAWATEPVPDTRGWPQAQIDSLIALYRERGDLLRLWWSEVMVDQQTSVTESMVLFWHDHFATGIDKVLFPQSMYIQNDLFRDYATGSFRELTRNVAYDPAMLLWLDGQYNRAGNVNENWARELLELFTLGVDHYTQDDVVAAARAFTGYYTTDGVTSAFNPAWHDNGYKVFLGQGGFWDGDDIIDIIFQQDETARFVCRKLYKWYVDEYPDDVLLDGLAQTLRDNDYQIAPVLRQIFLSEHFFDIDYRGSVIKDGVDHYAGLIRMLGMGPMLDLSDPEDNQSVFVTYSMFVYDQILFQPPNVAGWPGYRTWVNSYTLPWRKTLDVGLIDGIVLGYPITMQANVKALAQQFQDPNDPYQVVSDTAALFFGFQPTELVANRMLDELLQGAEPWEWNINDPNATQQLRALFRLTMRLPDFQLK
ncbi:MAG: DUF1800 domain-containing protein [Candidatus Eisenbacteria bacterium]|uniref:DUF1800 domain-containing protein n=1 Tax=Eiseniibacteriota bacterium TaxID=2212470 RepID=A0A956M225_UNCEI|nr:DUF1800 domain-containing protein [Candidatus Eisenbacteria bacterium]